MPDSLTFILGGARSGKSTYALRLAQESGRPVTFVATAVAFDEEMAARIAAHRAERPAGWRTVEAPREVAKAIQGSIGAGELLILDCLTLLANNVILSLPDPENGAAAQAALDAEVASLLEIWRQGGADWIVVSNEVGLGLVPEYPLGRVYRDALGRANQVLAGSATRVLLMVAGLPLVVK